MKDYIAWMVIDAFGDPVSVSKHESHCISRAECATESDWRNLQRNGYRCVRVKITKEEK